jgi:hypothetical protein
MPSARLRLAVRRIRTCGDAAAARDDERTPTRRDAYTGSSEKGRGTKTFQTCLSRNRALNSLHRNQPTSRKSEAQTPSDKRSVDSDSRRYSKPAASYRARTSDPLPLSLPSAFNRPGVRTPPSRAAKAAFSAFSRRKTEEGFEFHKSKSRGSIIGAWRARSKPSNQACK